MECQLYEIDPAEYLSHAEKAELKQQGTPEAEQELFRQHQRQLFKLAADFAQLYRFLELDDLLQAGAVGLIRAIREWNPDRSQLSTWAFHAIKNGMAGLLRTQRRYRQHIVGHADTREQVDLITLAQYTGPAAAAQFEQAEESRSFAAAVDHLASTNPRAASILRERLAGDSLQTIADRLGITKERVRQLESRAEQTVAEHMGGQAPARGYKRRGA